MSSRYDGLPYFLAFKKLCSEIMTGEYRKRVASQLTPEDKPLSPVHFTTLVRDV